MPAKVPAFSYLTKERDRIGLVHINTGVVIVTTDLI